ncbi:ComEC/Rec2 family competence protein [Mariniflexile gromovii]|uniref:ComEC/Rec2 family competence protein n=1 Tax=Mariniflexile gromovii TaxID=362523 RepID=A0ABS4BY15_9FLAO|nr:ComEC/Rec2 family competence protein [Mariniflexile gromovii]MBP0905475.1 ComEC/Rec2 family competence protein [Mariniflexile gromovii]
MKLLNFTIIKLTFCFILGIVIGYGFNIPLYINLLFAGIGFLLTTTFFLIARNKFVKTIWFGIFSFITMVLIGILVTNLHNDKNNPKHYSYLISKEPDSLKTITFRVREVLKPGNYYDKYIIDLLNIDNEEVIGKSLLNIQKDSLTKPLKVDAVFISKTAFKDLINPLNPNQFNYKSYLEKKYIYHQIFTTESSLFKVKSSTHTLFGIANNIRNHINEKLKPYHFKPDELAIINALLLGQRQDISEEVYTSYTNAGAIHILAISGLHIGLILLILQFIFKPVTQIKHGKLMNAILLVSILWSFAIIAGLSASVTRAVTMFSVVAIAKNLNRPTNIYNTLAISMLIILLFKPMFLFDVGFQLSYLAVFAIVAIDPLLYKLWKTKYWLPDTLWHTLTVTVSAQFGIIPLSLYYFHQFPSLFFLSNLVIIPLLGIILGFGILLIFLAILNILPQFIATSYGYVINLMNSFVGWISKQEDFLFKDIPFSLLHVFVSYIFIIALVLLYAKRNFSALKWFLISILLVQSAIIYTNSNTPKNQFIVFHKSRYTLLGNTMNKGITLASDLDTITKLKTKIVKDYTVGNHIKTIREDKLQPVYMLNTKKLLVIDSLGIYNIKSFQPDYVLLRQSPKINLNRLIDSLKPKYIIADGSNYKSYVEGWESVCKKRKLSFHQTSKKGAFIIKY